MPSSGDLIPFVYADSSTSQFGDSFNDRFTIFDDFSDWPVATVNVVTGEVTPFSDFEEFDYIGFGHTTNGTRYSVVGFFEDNVETSWVSEVGSGFNVTRLTKHVGGSMQRLHQLW